MNARADDVITLTVATRRAIDRARGIEGPLRDDKGRIIPMDAITKATRAAAKPEGGINMLTWERIYRRERAAELQRGDYNARGEAIKRASMMITTAAYVGQYLAARNLIR